MNYAKLVLLSVLLIALPSPGNGQSPQDTGIIAGPYGVPRLVQDDTGAWQEPIKVFENAETEVFIPDITGPTWAAWHIQRVGAKDFTYFLYVYTYYREKRATARELIYMDTSEPAHIVVQDMFERQKVDVSKNPTLAKIIAKITALVRPEANRQPDEVATLQNSVSQEKLAVSRMIGCSDSGFQAPDCQGETATSATIPKNQGSSGIGEGSDLGDHRLPDNDGVYRVGGSISAPVPLNNIEAGFTDEARRAKYQGICVIQMVVDANGIPQNPRVISGLKYGLNEKAIEAVRKYRFSPAMKDGKTPVPVMITVDVNFRLY